MWERKVIGCDYIKTKDGRPDQWKADVQWKLEDYRRDLNTTKLNLA